MLNIKRIFETIADAGQKILEKKSFKSIAKKRDLLDLCDDLLSTKYINQKKYGTLLKFQ